MRKTTLALATALATLATGLAVAQTSLARDGRGTASNASAANIRLAQSSKLETRTTFDIPAQPLGVSLKQVADQAGIQILFEERLVSGIRAPEIRANQSALETLQVLLKGTDLEFTAQNETVAVRSSKTATRTTAGLEKTSLRIAQNTGNTGNTGDTGEARNKSTVGASEAPTGAKDFLEEIVVTGTHIRGVPPASPLITFDQRQIERSGALTAGDVIRSIPQNFSGGNNPQVQPANGPGIDNQSQSGGSAPNLRGLGAGSTLTLINGHRLGQDMPSGAIDVSGIPVDVIERVEVLTDGASATYGSDAVGGVVNFILRKRFDGAQTAVSVGGATDGGASDRRFSQLVGKSWDTGGIVVSYEHDQQDPVYADQRSFTSSVLSPYTLLPSSNRDSGFISANQEISPSITAFVDGLYTQRSSEHFSTFPPSFDNQADVTQYVANFGFNANLPGRWEGSAYGNIAQQRTELSQYQFTVSAPDRSLTSFELYDGKTFTVEADANGPVVTLPSGDVRAALGTGHRHESYSDTQPNIATIVSNGSRNVDYAFGELSIPLVRPSQMPGINRLDVTFSGRYEHYSDAGSRAVPKIGVVYVPTEDLKFRATWGEAFRAPPLADVYGGATLVLINLPNQNSRTGSTTSIVRNGGNANLGPETAKTWTAGLDYTPRAAPGLKLSVTYYRIDYSNRITELPDVFAALGDPGSASFVALSPSAALQESIIGAAQGNLINATGQPYDPATVDAIVDHRPLNFARELASGVDALVDYDIQIGRNTLDLFANATYLKLDQQVVTNSPLVEISGTAFNPPTFRARGGASLIVDSWSFTGIVNYLSGETNNLAAVPIDISSWTTADAQIAYSTSQGGLLGGLQLILSAQNVFDAKPPHLEFNRFSNGFNYDSVNVNPADRFVSFQIRKRW